MTKKTTDRNILKKRFVELKNLLEVFIGLDAHSVTQHDLNRLYDNIDCNTFSQSLSSFCKLGWLDEASKASIIGLLNSALDSITPMLENFDKSKLLPMVTMLKLKATYIKDNLPFNLDV